MDCLVANTTPPHPAAFAAHQDRFKYQAEGKKRVGSKNY
jgi:hypothetical protein